MGAGALLQMWHRGFVTWSGRLRRAAEGNISRKVGLGTKREWVCLAMLPRRQRVMEGVFQRCRHLLGRVGRAVGVKVCRRWWHRDCPRSARSMGRKMGRVQGVRVLCRLQVLKKEGAARLRMRRVVVAQQKWWSLSERAEFSGWGLGLCLEK